MKRGFLFGLGSFFIVGVIAGLNELVGDTERHESKLAVEIPKQIRT